MSEQNSLRLVAGGKNVPMRAALAGTGAATAPGAGKADASSLIPAPAEPPRAPEQIAMLLH